MLTKEWAPSIMHKYTQYYVNTRETLTPAYLNVECRSISSVRKYT